jgi:vacuolar-type H+-ATPase subunit F/Vma7
MDAQTDSAPVVALGERHLLEGFPLAGVRLVAAETPEEVRAAWNRLAQTLTQPEAVVFLTPLAAAAVGSDPAASPRGPMTVVLPR